ncbi:tetratricopeptide repeat-containing diguanylate cyclase [Pseudoalteromonas piscicida]|uniref:diguanylate cyclase n=1 Tax=Pseudoalteromonas piscicida TaxID=43662 RepID=A0A2A5JLQ7_PSEO7|nr:GGDEF domain-containing protein [Pseudoalteromonas piscicida]PCK30368.1 GGDEF domain-containing protein [Pseudoalteromonas piscicida]
MRLTLVITHVVVLFCLVTSVCAYESKVQMQQRYDALFFSVEEDYDLALLPGVRALKEQARAQGNKSMQIKALLLEGSIVQHFGEFEDGLELHQQALQLADTDNNKALKANTYLAIAHLDIDLESFELAQRYLDKALLLANQIEDNAQLKAEISLWQARLYMDKGAYRLALSTATISPLAAIRKETIAQLNLTRSWSHLQLGEYRQAKAIIDALDDSKYLIKNQRMRLMAATQRARIALQSGDYKNAIELAQAGLKDTLGTRFLLFQSQLQWTLASAYAQLGDYQEAHRYLKRYTVTENSLNLQKRNNKLLKLEAQYSLAQQKQALDALERDNAQQAKVIVAHQQQIENARLSQQRWLLVALLIFILITVGYWRWQNRRYTKLLEHQVTARTEELAERNKRLQTLSFTDSLTGLSNRHHFFSVIDGKIETCKQHWQTAQFKQHADLIFMIVDIDHFKKINDTFGHAAGDIVLQDFAEILKQCTRDSDILVRWGGEEFMLVMPEISSSSAQEIAERIRAQVEIYPFMVNDQVINCTCSIGFAPFPFFPSQPEKLTWEQILELADGGLYLAKESHRNAWVGVYTEDSDSQVTGAQIVQNLHGHLQAGTVKTSSNIAALSYSRKAG